jgi:hypothetical protein
VRDQQVDGHGDSLSREVADLFGRASTLEAQITRSLDIDVARGLLYHIIDDGVDDDIDQAVREWALGCGYSIRRAEEQLAAEAGVELGEDFSLGEDAWQQIVDLWIGDGDRTYRATVETWMRDMYRFAAAVPDAELPDSTPRITRLQRAFGWLLRRHWLLMTLVRLLAFVRPLFVVSAAAALLLGPGPLRAVAVGIAAYSCVLFWLRGWRRFPMAEVVALWLIPVAVILLVVGLFT